MHPLRFKFDANVWSAQAHGCWLYVQLGRYALFCGSHMPFGVRLEWRSRVTRFRILKHKGL